MCINHLLTYWQRDCAQWRSPADTQVISSAAQYIFSTRPPVLHWLGSPERISRQPCLFVDAYTVFLLAISRTTSNVLPVQTANVFVHRHPRCHRRHHHHHNVTHSTNATHDCRRPCFSGRRKSSLRLYLLISQTRASQRLRTVAVSARLAPSHGSYRGPELVWATGRLMSPDRGFGTSCLLHCGHLTVSVNYSEDSWKRFCLSRTRLRRLVTLAFRRRI